jgi:hypothetical protein
MITAVKTAAAMAGIFAAAMFAAACGSATGPSPSPPTASSSKAAKAAAAVKPEFTDVESLLAALAVHGAPCTAVTFVNGTVPGGINPYADCTGVRAGDTAVSMFSSHSSALAYARQQMATSAGLGIAVAEVVGPNWTVNTIPAYARMAARAVGGRVISRAAAAPVVRPQPKPAPKPVVIVTFSGSGIENTRAFTTPANWHLSWWYSCANFGSEGNFQVYEYGTGGSLTSVLVNELGTGRGPVATWQYGDGGSHYLQVNSECTWSLTVVTNR